MTTDTTKPKRSARKKKAKKAKKKAKKTSVKKDQRKEVKKAVKQDSGGTLAERRAKIRERYDRAVVVYADDPPAEHVPIDFVMLGRLLGGGLKKGAVIEIAGWEDAGKTSLAIALAAAIQRAAPEGKNHVVMVNFEIVEDRVWWAQLGLKTDDDHFTMIADVPLEEGIGALADLIRSGEVCAAIVDSVYAASSRANDELLANWADPKGKQGGGGGIGVEARQWGVAWTAMKGLFTQFGVICLAVNQVRVKIEMGGGGGKKSYGPPATTTPRGSALKFYAWIRLELSGRMLVDEKDKRRTDVDGRKIRIKVIKNKTSGDQRGFTNYDLIRGQGFDFTSEVIDLCLEAGTIRKSGAWYYVGRKEKAVKLQGRAKLREWIEQDPRRREVLTQVVQRHLGRVEDDELFEPNVDVDDKEADKEGEE